MESKEGVIFWQCEKLPQKVITKCFLIRYNT